MHHQPHGESHGLPLTRVSPAAGTVFKRFDSTKLFALTCQDVVERFHLMLVPPC